MPGASADLPDASVSRPVEIKKESALSFGSAFPLFDSTITSVVRFLSITRTQDGHAHLLDHAAPHGKPQLLDSTLDSGVKF
jgi:hypothetical protein